MPKGQGKFFTPKGFGNEGEGIGIHTSKRGCSLNSGEKQELAPAVSPWCPRCLECRTCGRRPSKVPDVMAPDTDDL